MPKLVTSQQMRGLERAAAAAGVSERDLMAAAGLAAAQEAWMTLGTMEGRPVLVLSDRTSNATVTMAHTGTRDLGAVTRTADILVTAMGQPKAITAEMVRPGAVVIDVGTTQVGTTAKGNAILSGDVDFQAVREVAGAITPVPGGVGPMTRAMLLVNTLRAAKALEEARR
jgi:methylenetetrahydrofolate dehydrogenase (NADP+) / methenyltetrahydrofolate cyclohydrolase